MPIYEYQCDSCGFRVEKLWKRAALSEGKLLECNCGEIMRKLVSAANHTFVHPPSQLRGIAPPNTGTSDDWNMDKAIGRDSARRWKGIEGRGSVKDSVIRDERKAGRVVTRDQLVPTMDGTGYRVITEKERVKANSNRQAAFQIAQAAKEASAEE